MSMFLFKTRGNTDPAGKPRVYFTCHPNDFSRTFTKVCDDIFRVSDCAIYYTAEMTELIPDEDKELGLKRMNLVVVPITRNILTEGNRAMDVDIVFAKENGITILPVMFEPGLVALYSQNVLLGELQYIDPFSCDLTEISYEEKLKKFVKAVLIGNDLVKKIREEFAAYVFLSYRKKDRYLANKLMKFIHNFAEFRDVAIWFDEYLVPSQKFREKIYKMLAESKMFVLLVTPNILEEPDGKPNFVMKEEYPTAKDKGLVVFPVEMQKTDKTLLAAKYINIPDCVDPQGVRERFKQALTQIAVKVNNDIPKHNYLIGLAYRDGIDVEVNRERGIELIESAARAGMPDAARELVTMYYYGVCVQKSIRKAQDWQQTLIENIRAQYKTTPTTTGCLDLIDALRFYTEIARNGIDIQKKLGELLGYCTEALALCNQVECTNDKERSHLVESKANTMRSLAILYECCQDFDKALNLYEEVLLLRKNIYKNDAESGLTQMLVPNKWRIAQIYHDIGVLFERKRLYAKAVEKFEKALSIYEELVKATVVYMPNKIGVHNAIASNAAYIDINKAIRHNQIALCLSKELYEADPDAFSLLYARALYYKARILSSEKIHTQENIGAIYSQVKILIQPFCENPSLDVFPIVAGTYQKLCSIHVLTGEEAEQNEEFDVAIQNYLEATQEMETMERLGLVVDQLDVADLYDRIALCYEMQQAYEEAHRNYAQAALAAVNTAKESNRLDAFNAAIVYTQKLASFCDDFGDAEEAEYHYAFCLLLEKEREHAVSAQLNEDEGDEDSAVAVLEDGKLSDGEIARNLEALLDKFLDIPEDTDD